LPPGVYPIAVNKYYYYIIIYLDDILFVYENTSTDTDEFPQPFNVIQPILFKKEITDNCGTQSNHSNAT
jgi:hypothetical protein